MADTDDLEYPTQEATIIMTYQIERQRAGGSWTLHRGGQKFKNSDAAWEMLYQTMAWGPGMRLRLRAFREDPYESAAKYLYPTSCQA